MNSQSNPNPIFDTDGFMRDMNAWNEDLARRIAAMDGLGELDERQISLLRQMRDSYRRRGALPALPHVCRLDGLEPDCLTQVFPSAREVWRLAGLPNPGEEAKSYM